jgi:hypothetical protein
MKPFQPYLLVLLLGVLVSGLQAEGLSFERDRLSIEVGEITTVEYPDGRPVPVGSGLILVARPYVLALEPDEKADQFIAELDTVIDLGMVVPSDYLRDAVTSADDEYASVVAERNSVGRFGFRPLEITGERSVDGRRCVELLVFPVTVDSTGRLLFHPSIDLTVNGRPVAPSEFIPHDEAVVSWREARPAANASVQAEYLIVTSTLLAETMQALAGYKSETGIKTVVETIEAILPLYSGRDHAERLRERFKTFYAEGGRYVLLAGDETILPVRYAYPNVAYVTPEVGLQQVCDLYFADLTGDWDADGDGAWGEKYGDDVDIEPELLVGRLPINSVEAATNYVNKVIRYESDPGAGERSYLERAFFFSSDQMRDYGDGGQHRAIAGAYPSWFTIDTSSAVEQATGSDPAPTNLSPAELAPILCGGFGIVNVIAHGRNDGFVVKSSGYNDWPKSYLLTNGDQSPQGGFLPFTIEEKPGFYYSLACNNGGFDMDQPPMNQASPNLAEELIGIRGGAVAMVAYSRWGWISSSYILQRAFFDSLFAHPERSAVEAMYASKRVLYYYRDLVYGQNYFGDPTLKVYTHQPSKPAISANLTEHGLDVSVTVNGDGVADCRLILAEAGEVLAEYATDSHGRVTIDYPFESTGHYRLSALLENAAVTQEDFIPSLVTWVEEDDDPGSLLPKQFALHQNYPNPFNPSTTIGFDLPTPGPVRVAVYNILGQTVAVLADEYYPAGSYQLTWDGSAESGVSAASGAYFYRLETASEALVRKMILMK